MEGAETALDSVKIKVPILLLWALPIAITRSLTNTRN